MPRQMTLEELDSVRESATEVDTHEYRTPDDEDGYFTAALGKLFGGRHNRVVESSGYNSQFAAAGDQVWLEASEVPRWKQF